MAIDNAQFWLSLENILRIAEILSILGGGTVVAFKLGRSTQKMESAIVASRQSSDKHTQELAELRIEIKKLNDVLTQLSLQEQRLDMMSRQIEEMRHGQGFISFPPIAQPR